VSVDRLAASGPGVARPENKVALGFVEGLNNKIRVIQRRSYGLRDEEYLRLKILTCMPGAGGRGGRCIDRGTLTGRGAAR
jgi:hypothetical protein